MQTSVFILLIIHIAAGTASLLSGLGAIIFRNKVKIHKPFGRVYFWSMTAVFFTAVYISSVKGNIFLFCVAFFTYYSTLTAYRALRLKKLHLDQKPGKLDWGIEIFFGLMHLAFITLAVLLLMGPNKTFGIISLVFGLIGVQGNYNTIKRLRGNLEYKNYWLLAHIGGMLGSYIGAITAFVVNNGNHIPLPPIALWLGPAALIVPLIIFEVNKYKKKAGKFSEVKVNA